MEIESVECDCCGLREDCTQEYISGVKADFDGKWLCGLCAEAVRDEAGRDLQVGIRRTKACGGGGGVDEALRAHMSFCRKFRSNPAVRVADGMRQMLRRRSGDLTPPSASAPASASSKKKFGR